MTVFWIVAPHNLVEVTDISEVLDASIIRAEAADTSETQVNYQTTQGNNPEDGPPQSHCCEYLKCHFIIPEASMISHCLQKSYMM
jgi:hypothetical protein